MPAYRWHFCFQGQASKPLPAPAWQETGSLNPYPRRQAHPGPHRHCGPQAHTAVGTACCTGRLWQPQAQPWPGQSVQVHEVGVVVFMAFLLWLKVMPV
jgi:hypothetical protein